MGPNTEGMVKTEAMEGERHMEAERGAGEVEFGNRKTFLSHSQDGSHCQPHYFSHSVPLQSVSCSYYSQSPWLSPQSRNRTSSLICYFPTDRVTSQYVMGQ